MALEAVAISTSKYVKSVNAKIDEHVYVVHKMGAGTQLDLSREISSLARLRTTILNFEGKLKATTDEAEQEKLMTDMADKLDEFDKSVRRIEDVFVGLFDDRENGDKSRRLIHMLGIDNAQKLYDEIFEKAEDGTTNK